MRQPAEPTRGEIERVIRSHLNVHKRVNEASGPHVIADCVVCGKPKHLYVNEDTGAWDCKVCGAAGGFWKLADAVGVRVRDPSMVRSPVSVMLAQRVATQSSRTAPARPVTNGPNLDVARVAASCDRLFNDEDKEGQSVRAYLRERGFTDDTIRRFKLGVCRMQSKDDTAGQWVAEVGVSIPYIEDGKVPLVKMRNLEKDKDKRRFLRTKGGSSTLFNADAVRGARRAVLVEGELDAISVHQCGITTVASTSLGAKKTIPAEWLQALEEVQEVVLWYDADDAGQESTQALVHELGSWRVKLASIDDETAKHVQAKTGKRPKDANDLLKAGVDHAVIRAIIDGALPVDNVMVVTADRYIDPLAAVIDQAEQSLGPSTGLAVLDNTLRGWRTQELILVTGHTSHGKSTFALDRCLELAERGEPVLVSALENGPLTLARKMFQRYFGGPISGIKRDEDKERAYEVLNALNRNPVHILDAYGRLPMATLVDCITYARRRHGTKFVMLDHLHFIQPRNERRDEREAMDDILLELTELTRRVDCMIFLVAHPRGSVEQSTIPTGDSVKGTSSAKQLCDNGITVWRNMDNAGDNTVRKLNLRDGLGRRMEVDIGGDEALVYVWKARHDEATTGAGVMKFDGRKLKFVPRPDVTEQPVDARTGEKSEPAQQQLSISDPFND